MPHITFPCKNMQNCKISIQHANLYQPSYTEGSPTLWQIFSTLPLWEIINTHLYQPTRFFYVNPDSGGLLDVAWVGGGSKQASGLSCTALCRPMRWAKTTSLLSIQELPPPPFYKKKPLKALDSLIWLATQGQVSLGVFTTYIHLASLAWLVSNLSSSVGSSRSWKIYGERLKICKLFNVDKHSFLCLEVYFHVRKCTSDKSFRSISINN